jgi:hypothetical protein
VPDRAIGPPGLHPGLDSPRNVAPGRWIWGLEPTNLLVVLSGHPLVDIVERQRPEADGTIAEHDA